MRSKFERYEKIKIYILFGLTVILLTGMLFVVPMAMAVKQLDADQAVNETKSDGTGYFRAAPHNSARDSSERFCSKIKFEKRRNTLCISSFSNCNIGTKDPLMSADAIVRCCHKERNHKTSLI